MIPWGIWKGRCIQIPKTSLQLLTRDRISGDMSDLKYGTTDQHVIKELKVYQLIASTDNAEALVQTSDILLNQ